LKTGLDGAGIRTLDASSVTSSGLEVIV